MEISTGHTRRTSAPKPLLLATLFCAYAAVQASTIDFGPPIPVLSGGVPLDAGYVITCERTD